MISMDPNIALHVSIQKVNPVLKTVLSELPFIYPSANIQRLQTDRKDFSFKPYAK